METLLRIKNLTKIYGGRKNITKALNGLSFSIQEGEVVGFMGQSGSGKSTLLNILSTLDKSTSGEVYFKDTLLNNLPKRALPRFRRANIGIIFQHYNLVDGLTSKENIQLSLSINDFSPRKIEERIDELSRLFNLEYILNKYPDELSGGQKQLVATARAISTSPTLILADEPTGALDSKSAKLFLNTIIDLNKNFNSTILMVTHDPIVASYCKRVIFIKDGKVFTEIYKGDLDNSIFFNKILNVVSLLGGNTFNDI